ncbi:hypothetical protein TREMEDRAFT_68451 [Tremella mesenterica DSM 1558]|uniref:uncharacterized protein n=1 Tax=Tremella mesenterica (strain ATCC 24925 / CBS 8224 / DSM 1558 / NBRC 9311 / NRRL Y-6157 / RJB 2259-6 / UBC 559-6) TaxID=578456 RepID=UPI0003F4A0C8|nr:uncharacterized protein TREMEDRAFT_68451 [Tremella mesenterica DSM 1558]EIW70044.1 hypothetical protein TREMEDRAFT_68451 [Tremella mesenterica DSM 1558]
MSLLSLFATPPGPVTSQYDGWEYRWKMFVIRPAEFKMEGLLFGIGGLYLLIYYLGKVINDRRAQSTISPFRSLLETQFERIRPLVSASPAKRLLYATGRRNVLFLHATILFWPWHDVAGFIQHLGMIIFAPAYDGSETITFEVTLGRGEDGLQDGQGVGVWALVNKSILRTLRQARYDLTFPRLVESAPNIPITHVLFNEHSDCSDILLKTPNVGITELINDPVSAKVLKYLLITDVSALKPQRGALPTKVKSRQVVLSVYKPSSKAQYAAVAGWVQVALNIADLLSKPNLVKAEVTRKLLRTRQQVDSELTAEYKRALSENTVPQETVDEKRAAKKKAERASMTEKELKRVEELEKKREQRKQQKKQMIR